MADHPLLGSYLKLQRAYQHYDATSRALDRFRESQGDIITTEIDPDTGEKVWVVGENLGQPPAAIGLIIGDTVHNARASLDYLANAMLRWMDLVPTAQTQFPIFRDHKRFRDRNPKQTEGMPPGMLRMIELSQPYKRTPRPSSHPLWLVHSLDVIDKHRQLHVTLASVHTLVVFPRYEELRARLGPLEAGAELSRVPPDQMEMEYRPVIEVAFRSGPVRNEPVLRVLHEILLEVFNVLERFRERLFASAHGELPKFPDFLM